MGRWWNRMPQYDGLFDYQNTIRPAYFAFKLLSRLTGDRLSFKSSDAAVHGFFTYDPLYLTNNLLIWNFSPQPVKVTIDAKDAPGKLLVRPELLDAMAASSDENARLRPLNPVTIEPGAFHTEVERGALWNSLLVVRANTLVKCAVEKLADAQRRPNLNPMSRKQRCPSGQ